MLRLSRRGDLQPRESSVLDVIYLLTTLALFALVGLVARAVEKIR